MLKRAAPMQSGLIGLLATLGGALQIEEQSPPHPAGATVLNTRNIML